MRKFVQELSFSLLYGDWKNCPVTSDNIMATTPNDMDANVDPTRSKVDPVSCIPIDTLRMQHDQTIKRAARKCVVCRWENRGGSERTSYCKAHLVSLCQQIFPHEHPTPWMCPDTSLTCWAKFHQYYTTKAKLFDTGPREKKTSELYRLRTVYLNENDLTTKDGTIMRGDMKWTYIPVSTAPVVIHI